MKSIQNTMLWLVMAAMTASSLNAAYYTAPTGSAYTTSTAGKFVGKLTIGSAGHGTATVARPYTVLTAAHCLWSPTQGWLPSAKFYRGYYNGSYASVATSRQRWILGGYMSACHTSGQTSPAAFAKDTGAVVLWTMPAGGGYMAAQSSGASLLNSTLSKMSLGYGADVHNGQMLLWSDSTNRFTAQSGSWMVNPKMGGERGMSGGPLLVWSSNAWKLAGVIVSGPGNNYSYLGSRAADSATISLLNTLP